MKGLFRDEDNLFNIDISKIKPGTVLLSEPFMVDPNFKRTVVLICEHNEEGTVGFIINRNTDVRLAEAVEEIEGFDAPLYFGGPVQTDTLHYFHNMGETIEGSVQIAPGLYWGGNFEALKILIQSGKARADEMRFYAGYSGWGAGQLEDELKQKSWLIAEIKPEHMFDAEPDELWKKILKDMGGDYSILSNFPEDPSFN